MATAATANTPGNTARRTEDNTRFGPKGYALPAMLANDFFTNKRGR